MEEKISIGGQAVLEGVMMRGTEFLATAVRRDTGEIVYRKRKISSRKKEFYKMPLIRGIFMLFDCLVLGVQELTFSANQSGTEKEEVLTQKERSDERRAGEECRSRRSPYHYKQQCYSSRWRVRSTS